MAPHILVVDDDNAIRKLARMVLEDVGYAVSEAADGAVALTYLRERPERLVVTLDLRMPRMDGRQVLETVAADPTLANHRAYILITANADMVSPPFSDLLAHLRVPVLTKPFSVGELLQAVAEAANRLDTESAAM